MVDEFLSKLLDKYGFLRIAVVVAIIMIFAWVIAHFAAAPGGNVSVLWGLVQYTKSKPETSAVVHSTNKSEPKEQQTFSQDQKISGGPSDTPNDLYVIHGLTAKTLDQTLKELRVKRQLRPLEALESGLPVSEIPQGTYFFVFYYGLTATQGRMAEELRKQKVNRFRENNAYFEIHLPKTGSPVVLGFASESDAIRAGSLTRQTQKISIAAVSWEKMPSLISLPTDRILIAKGRTLNVTEGKTIEILDCEIR